MHEFIEREKYEKYLGEIYYKILNISSNKKFNNIIEFAPGFRCKIAYALEKINFDGVIYIIDINKKVLEFIYEKYTKIIPNAKIILINKELLDSINYIPKKIDLFLSNHCIDDLIIGKFLQNKERESAFDDLKNSKEILVKNWNYLKEDINKQKDIMDLVYKELSVFFNSVDIKTVVMSQYKSGYFLDQRTISDEISKLVFDKLKLDFDLELNKLKKALDFDGPEFEFTKNKGFSLKENIQHYDNWILGKIKK